MKTKRIFPETATISYSEILNATKAGDIVWVYQKAIGSNRRNVIAALYKGWTLTIEDAFLWASAEGTLIPLGGNPHNSELFSIASKITP